MSKLNNTNNKLLDVSDLSMRFGGLLAVNGVKLDVDKGEVISIIGPNGAGKTTIFNCLTGFYRPTGGTIRYRGEEIQGLPGHLIARKGIVRTFQHVRLFKEMTAVENLLVAQHMWVNRSLLAGILNTKGYRKAESDALDHAFYWLEVVDLVDCANRLAGELSYGQQRRLEIARAMCTRPQIICLDEPAAGLNPQETEALSGMIRLLRDEHDLTVVLIEHDMGMVMSISDHIVVLDHGNVIAEGGPEAIRNDPKVIAAYLGADEEELI